jgi:signal transduction histidine kinase
LTNVVHHAPGAAARVKLACTPAGLEVLIEDDGSKEEPGPESRHGAGQGLTGMRKRVIAVGGTLETGPRPDRGFLVRAVFPLAPPRT